MTMQMVGNHPDVWAAASAWVGISDLAAWHKLHANDKYGAMLRKSCGGAPGESAATDQQYRERSPVTHLANAKNVPLDIAAGIYDGHFGSVPVSHSLLAFNVVAKADGDYTGITTLGTGAGEAQSGPVSESEIVQLGNAAWWTNVGLGARLLPDQAYDRTIYFRRSSGNCRVTLFEGGHERLDAAALSWLESHTKE
jgi:hypothetical protein